jgi:hypothetical protein
MVHHPLQSIALDVQHVDGVGIRKLTPHHLRRSTLVSPVVGDSPERSAEVVQPVPGHACAFAQSPELFDQQLGFKRLAILPRKEQPVARWDHGTQFRPDWDLAGDLVLTAWLGEVRPAKHLSGEVGHLVRSHGEVDPEHDHEPEAVTGVLEQAAELRWSVGLELSTITPELPLRRQGKHLDRPGCRVELGRPLHVVADVPDVLQPALGTERGDQVDECCGLLLAQFTDVGLGVDALQDLEGRVLVVGDSSPIQFGSDLDVKEMVETILQADPGTTVAGSGQSPEVLFEVVVGIAGRRTCLEGADPTGFSPESFVPTAAGLSEPVLGRSSGHGVSFTVRRNDCEAENVGNNSQESTVGVWTVDPEVAGSSPVVLAERILGNYRGFFAFQTPDSPLCSFDRGRFHPQYLLKNRGRRYAQRYAHGLQGCTFVLRRAGGAA